MKNEKLREARSAHQPTEQEYTPVPKKGRAESLFTKNKHTLPRTEPASRERNAFDGIYSMSKKEKRVLLLKKLLIFLLCSMKQTL